MATPRVNMDGFLKQKKKGNYVISKSKGRVNKKTTPNSSAKRSNVVQPPSKSSSLPEYDTNEEMLRQFDLNSTYGPCLGMSRIERWNRAKKFGLNPPEEIEVLLKSGEVQTECLWHGRKVVS